MRIPGFAERAPWEVVKLAVKDFLDDDMATYAAALSFHVLLALFPFIIFLLTLLGATGLAPFFDQLLGQARVTLPPDAFQILEQVVGEIRNRPGQGILSFSIVLALWAASAGMRSVTNALNRAYDVDETRPIWQRYPLSVLYTIGLAALVLLSGAARLAGPQVVERVTNRFGITSHIATLWTWLRWPAVVALLLLVVALIYYLGPNVDQSFRYVTPGSVTALIVWIIASAGFSAYIERFGDYGATYGSLGGMIVLLLYFFVSGGRAPLRRRDQRRHPPRRAHAHGNAARNGAADDRGVGDLRGATPGGVTRTPTAGGVGASPVAFGVRVRMSTLTSPRTGSAFSLRENALGVGALPKPVSEA